MQKQRMQTYLAGEHDKETLLQFLDQLGRCQQWNNLQAQRLSWEALGALDPGIQATDLVLPPAAGAHYLLYYQHSPGDIIIASIVFHELEQTLDYSSR